MSDDRFFETSQARLDEGSCHHIEKDSIIDYSVEASSRFFDMKEVIGGFSTLDEGAVLIKNINDSV